MAPMQKIISFGCFFITNLLNIHISTPSQIQFVLYRRPVAVRYPMVLVDQHWFKELRFLSNHNVCNQLCNAKRNCPVILWKSNCKAIWPIFQFYCIFLLYLFDNRLIAVFYLSSSRKRETCSLTRLEHVKGALVYSKNDSNYSSFFNAPYFLKVCLSLQENPSLEPFERSPFPFSTDISTKRMDIKRIEQKMTPTLFALT